MNNFKIIYRILKYLEQSMDNEIFEISPISAEQLGISRERWAALLCLLQDEGYISGLIFTQTMSDSKPLLMEPVRPSITLKGLEYLTDNSMMHKAGNLLKGLKDMLPGV